jgi:excisionase family DNA binding protein
MINETLAAYLEEIIARGVLRALREAGLVQQATGHHRPASGALLTADEAGRRLRVPRKAVYELVRAGVLPAVHVGRRLRVPEGAIVAVLEQAMPAGRQELEGAKTKSA